MKTILAGLLLTVTVTLSAVLPENGPSLTTHSLRKIYPKKLIEWNYYDDSLEIDTQKEHEKTRNVNQHETPRVSSDEFPVWAEEISVEWALDEEGSGEDASDEDASDEDASDEEASLKDDLSEGKVKLMSGNILQDTWKEIKQAAEWVWEKIKSLFSR